MDVLSVILTGAVGCAQIGYAAGDARGPSFWKTALCCLVYLAAAQICGLCFPNQMLAGLLWQIALVYGVSTLVLRIPPGAAATDALLAVCLTQLCVGVGSSAQSLILPSLFGRPEFEAARAATVGLIVLSSVLACALARRLRPGTQDPRFQTALAVPLVFYCLAEVYLLELMYKEVSPVSRPDAVHVQLLALQALGLLAVFSTLAVSRRALKALEADRASRNLRRELALQRRYVEEARSRYDRTRSLRHDIKNHLIVLDGLLKTGRTDEGRDYLAKLRAVADMTSLPVHTGNPVVDVVVEAKLRRARQEDIETEILGSLPGGRGPDDFDLCILFANALDNAIEACRAQEGSRWIRITCASREDLCLLSFENSCSGAGPFREDIGFGNMRGVAEKYNGLLEARMEGGVFSLRVLLSISEPVRDSSEQFR